MFLLLLVGGRALAQEYFEVNTDTCVLKLDKSNGNLIGLHWLDPDEEVIKEGRLGENFRLLLPLPGYQANYFLSGDQKAHFTRLPNGVVCHYGTLRNERRSSWRFQIVLNVDVSSAIFFENHFASRPRLFN